MRNKTGMQMLTEAKEEIEKVWIDEIKHISDKVWKIVIEKLMNYEKDYQYSTKEDIFKGMDKALDEATRYPRPNVVVKGKLVTPEVEKVVKVF